MLTPNIIEMTTNKASSKKEARHRITPAQQMISSCAGSMVTSLMVTPLDVVKVRLQSEHRTVPKSKKCYLYCHGYVEELCCELHAGNGRVWPKRAFTTGTLGTFANITRTEGLSSLWSGLPTTLAMAVPATVIYFTMYDQLRHRLSSLSSSSTIPIWVPVLAGASARAICVTVISPLEMIRTKMQSTRTSYKEIRDAVRSHVRKLGLLSMWRGVGPTYWRDVPFSALYWASYELLKSRFKQETPTWSFSFVAGAISGTTAAVVTLPFDVVKTRAQVVLGDKTTTFTRKSTFELLFEVYRKSGYKGLYVGIVPRVIKIAPACAIMISTYEYGKQYFYKHNASKSAII